VVISVGRFLGGEHLAVLNELILIREATSGAIIYYHMISKLLGDGWLRPERFRIGASRLANNLLTRISDRVVRYF
jgi:hypothetical protein